MYVARFGFERYNASIAAKRGALSLLRAGADVRLATNNGWTALAIITRHGFNSVASGQAAKDMVFAMLDAGADPRVATNADWTPLTLISRRFNNIGENPATATDEEVELRINTALALLRNGAHPDVDDDDDDAIHDRIKTAIKNFPRVRTLRTLCINVVHQNRVQWQGVVPPLLMRYPDEVEEHQLAQEIEKVQREAQAARAKKRKREQDEWDDRFVRQK
jgi:hypothetical protein